MRDPRGFVMVDEWMRTSAPGCCHRRRDAVATPGERGVGRGDRRGRAAAGTKWHGWTMIACRVGVRAPEVGAVV